MDVSFISGFLLHSWFVFSMWR